MPMETGTLILADYTARIKDTGQIIETTRKADAEKAGNADPTRTYEPRLIAVGEGWVLKGLDEELARSDPGQTLDVELSPAKAFGLRDPQRVSRVPIRKFGEKANELSVGAEIEVDNRVGIVRAIESGRVFLDFNHKYAGKTLEYNVDIKEKLESKDAKVLALVRRRLPIDKEKVKFEFEGDDKIKITIPSDYFLVEGLQIIKRGISQDLFKFVKPLAKVDFVEEYENPTEKAEGAQLALEADKKVEEGGAKQSEVPSSSSADAKEKEERVQTQKAA